MTGSGDLERRYRGLLRWYPASFRREYEEEMLGVLMAGQPTSRRRPRPPEYLDLIAGGIRLRLRPTSPRPTAGATRAAIRLMIVGAVLELLAAVTVLGTAGEVGASLTAQASGASNAITQAAVVDRVELVGLAAIVAAFAWLGLAWAIGRGQRWPRIAFIMLFGINLAGLVRGLAEGSAAFARADLGVAIVLCLVQLAAVVLLLDPAGRTGGLLAAVGSMARRLIRPAAP